MTFVVMREFPARGYELDEELGRFETELQATAHANVMSNEGSEHDEYVVYDANDVEVYWTPGKKQCLDVSHINENDCPTGRSEQTSTDEGEKR